MKDYSWDVSAEQSDSTYYSDDQSAVEQEATDYSWNSTDYPDDQSAVKQEDMVYSEAHKLNDSPRQLISQQRSNQTGTQG